MRVRGERKKTRRIYRRKREREVKGEEEAE
jgi:hypothetical protein